MRKEKELPVEERRVLTAREMKAAEDAAVARGGSYEALMERAGEASAQMIEKILYSQTAIRPVNTSSKLHTGPVLFLCGKGNNAGDALVAARLLAEKGRACALLFLCGQALSPLAALNLARLPEEVELLPAEQPAQDRAPANPPEAADTPPGEAWAQRPWALVVDAVFGTGFRGELPPAVALAFRRANALPYPRLALDLPSGLNCDTGHVARHCFRAGHTLTFGAYKPGLLLPQAAPWVGQVSLADIGL